MLLNDPMLYGANFVNREIPVQTPFMGQYLPWQNIARFLPNFGSFPFQNVLPPYAAMTPPVFQPWNQFATQFPYAQLPYNQLPYNQLPYSQVPYNQLPYNQLPYNQLPYAQLPYAQPFAQQPFNVGLPFAGWQRPFIG